jgi:hypothetical protein
LSRLQVYRQKFLLPRWKATGQRDGRIILHTRTATWLLPGLLWQVLKLHVCAPHCPAAAAGSQTASKRSAVMQWQDTKLHARMRAAALLQWQNIKLHARMRPAALLQWQKIKLHARVAALLQWQVLKLLN